MPGRADAERTRCASSGANHLAPSAAKLVAPGGTGRGRTLVMNAFA